MKSRNLLIPVGLILFAAASIFAQTGKTLTNDKLEKIRESRLKADAEYREERKRRGLPPLEEVEREREKVAQERREFSAKLARERNEQQNFYLNQAVALRAEIISLDAQILYVRARIRRVPRPQIYYAVNYLPFFNAYPGNFPQPLYYGSNRRVTISEGKIGNGANSNVRTGGVNQSGAIAVFSNDTNATSARPNYPTGTLVVPFTFPSYDQLTRQELLSNLRSLEQTRAGLFARWRLLEEEARQDGVRID